MRTQLEALRNRSGFIGVPIFGLLALACLILLLHGPGRASAASQRDTGGVPQATCFWFGPATMSNPATNLAYPEESAVYWGARFRLPTGATLLLDGKYPHARFMSLNAYLDKASTDDLFDSEIQPDPGSTNPYLVGANRYAKNRSFQVSVPGPSTPTDGLVNVLDSRADGEGVQELIYRVYLPDSKADRSTRSLPSPSVKLASGEIVKGKSACDLINDPQRYFTMQTMPDWYFSALVNTAGADAAKNPAQRPLRWEKYFNLDLALSIFSYGTSSESERLVDLAQGERGAYYDNKAVKYLIGPINQAYGKVLMLQGKLPTTPSTSRRVRRMGSGQLRYWSVCENSSPVETKGIDCVNDADLKGLIDAQRRYTVVVSRAVSRPKDAVKRCGVAWLNWGEARDVLGRRSGTLVIRNLGANPNFANSAQKIAIDDLDVTKNSADTTDNQRGVMGDYLPTGTYFADKTAFDNSFNCGG